MTLFIQLDIEAPFTPQVVILGGNFQYFETEVIFHAIAMFRR